MGLCLSSKIRIKNLSAKYSPSTFAAHQNYAEKSTTGALKTKLEK